MACDLFKRMETGFYGAVAIKEASLKSPDLSFKS